MKITWSSEPIRLDACLCFDVKAGPDGVVLGQIHGEHGDFASDTRMAAEKAEALALALLQGAREARA